MVLPLLKNWLSRRTLAVLCFFLTASFVPAAGEMRELDTPCFQVYSDARDSDILAWSKQFERYRSTVKSLCGLRDEEVLQLSVLAFAKEDAFMKLVPGSENVHNMTVAFFYLYADHEPTLALALDKAGSAARYRQNVAAANWIIGSMEPYFDPWLLHGLTNLFSTLDITGDRASIGTVPPTLDVAGMKRHTVLMADMLQARHEQFTSLQDLVRTELFEDYTWAVAQELFLKDGWHGLQRAIDYQARVARGEARPAAFKAVFGLSPAEMDARIKKGLSGGFSASIYVPAAPKPADAVFVQRQADHAAAATIMGQLLNARGRPDLGRSYFQKAREANPDSLRLAEAEWLQGVQERNQDGAETALAHAVALGSKNYRVQQAWVQVLFDRAMAGASSGFELDPALCAQMTTVLDEILARKPNYTRGYSIYAVVGASLPPDPKVVTVLQRGLDGPMKDDPLLKIGIAASEWRAERNTEARNRLDAVELPSDANRVVRGFKAWLDSQLAAAELAASVRKALDEGQIPTAMTGYAQIEGRPVANPALKKQIGALRREIDGHKLLDRAEQFIRDGSVADGRSLIEDLVSHSVEPSVQKRAGEILARTAAK